MENYSYSSYPDSGDSSPRSREIDSENQSWDEPLANYKVKFMCSYGGKIQPRQHDNQLAYVGGDTKILAVDRSIKFPAIMSKLSALYGDDNVCFKYQLPGEDLDALISVTNDEDLEHMMLEYDRLYRASAKPARLRLFLFPLNPKVSAVFGAGEPKSERQWFVDALNSAQIQALDGSSPPAAAASAANPDFLFGLDKPKLAEVVTSSTTVPEVVGKDVTAGSDCGSEDRHVIGEHMVEIQRQEFQRLNISGVSGLEQVNQNPRTSYVGQKIVTEKIAPPPGQLPMPMQMTIPATYLTERHLTPASYQTEQPVYFIPAAPAPGMYSAPTLRPGGQAYYGMQRVVTEQPVYNVVSAAPPPPKVGGYGEGIGVMQQQKGGMMAEPGYVQMGYDGTGRQVYYTTAAAAGPTQGGMVAQYQAVAMDGRQPGGTLNQEGGTSCSPYGAGIGEVKERAIHKSIGFEAATPEFGTNWNHFSVQSSETVFMKSCSEIETVPNNSTTFTMGNSDSEGDKEAALMSVW